MSTRWLPYHALWSVICNNKQVTNTGFVPSPVRNHKLVIYAWISSIKAARTSLLSKNSPRPHGAHACALLLQCTSWQDRCNTGSKMPVLGPWGITACVWPQDGYRIMHWGASPATTSSTAQRACARTQTIAHTHCTTNFQDSVVAAPWGRALLCCSAA